jgi:DNA-binding NarL/FixJ family response regulator
VVLVEDGFADVTASEMLAIAEAEKLPTRFVIYTASVARGEIAAAIAAGACNAISMRAEPETLLNSLRLVAPRNDRGPAGKQENGGTGEDVLAALTDQERKIMRLVAYGMSNKEIARQLNANPGAIKAQLNLIFQKVKIENRTELAALVLSRLSGGISALAGLIFAALDDVRAAHSNEADHTPGDSFTLMAADDSAGIATIVITPRKTGAAGISAKGTIKAGRVDSPGKGTPAATGKLVDLGGDIISTTMQPASADSARPSLGSSSAFMMVVAGVLIYELDGLCRSAQAFELGNSLTDFSTSDAANGSRDSIAFNTLGSANANFGGFDGLAWSGFEKYDSSFAFDAPRSAAITIPGDEIAIVGADAINDSDDHAVNRHETIYTSSATVNTSPGHSMDHGVSGETAASDTSQPFEHGASSASDEHSNRSSQGDLHADEDGPAAAKPQHAKNEPPGHDPDHGQSQRDSHASEDDAAATKQHVKHEPPGHDPNHGQSQSNSHVSEDGAAAAKQHVKHEPPGHDPNHGQSQSDSHLSADGAAAAEPHAKHEPPGHYPNHGQSQSDSHVSDDGSTAAEQLAKHGATHGNEANHGQSEPDVHAGPANAANNPHSQSGLNAGGNDQVHDGPAEMAGAPLGDSFHFKVMEGSNASDDFALHVGHEPASIEHGPHTAGNDGPASIQQADLVSLLVAEQNPVDHGKGAEHHLMHDLFV